jgi:hypothetical protein
LLNLAGIEPLNGVVIAMARTRCIPNVFEFKAFAAFLPGNYCPYIFGIPIVVNGSGPNHKGSGSQWRRHFRSDLAQPCYRTVRSVVDERDQPIEYRGPAQ